MALLKFKLQAMEKKREGFCGIKAQESLLALVC